MLPISVQVDRVHVTETIDVVSIPSRIKSNKIKIGIHSFPVQCSALKGQFEAAIVCGTLLAA